MNDKSKLPDLKEVTSMVSKLCKDIKTSFSEIIDEYKKKREVDKAAPEKEKVKKTTKAHKSTKADEKKTEE